MAAVGVVDDPQLAMTKTALITNKNTLKLRIKLSFNVYITKLDLQFNDLKRGLKYFFEAFG
tara:strand:+ start:467 stop:649 length:183 start_codon:yes stop_codon:yes gene_type:complete